MYSGKKTPEIIPLLLYTRVTSPAKHLTKTTRRLSNLYYYYLLGDNLHSLLVGIAHPTGLVVAQCFSKVKNLDNQREKTLWEKIASGQFSHDLTSPSNISQTLQGDCQIFYLPALASNFTQFGSPLPSGCVLLDT